MKNYQHVLIAVLIAVIVMGLFATAPAQAAGGSTTKCTVWATSPSQSGKTLTSKGYVNCGTNGNYLPYLQMCIVKKTWYGTKTIGCTSKDYMGAYLQTWNKSLSVSCDGSGTYFAEVKWQEFSLWNVANYIKGISIPGMVWKIVTGVFGTEFRVQSVPYTYCK